MWGRIQVLSLMATEYPKSGMRTGVV
uniref:Uncharacterized protein n=1 Tax=Anguilla anguilla TaxID=7936 RepID=A0A0E9QNZ4_ANGAN